MLKWLELAVGGLTHRPSFSLPCALQAEDDRRRKEDEVMLTLACMDTMEGTVNFAKRLTAQGEKVRSWPFMDQAAPRSHVVF